MDDCQIEKVVELSPEQFSALTVTPLRDQPFIAENKGCMFSKDGVLHCLLALGQGSRDGVLIESEGYNYPRYAAYVPGMRDIVSAQMERAADLIVRQGTEHTASGSWAVYFEELEEQLGLSSRPGSGLDDMLKETLERRPEVAGVELVGGGFDTTYRPEFCKGLQSSTEKKKPDIRVRDILPLLTGGGLAFLCHEEGEGSVLAENLRELTAAGREDHAALLNAWVAEVCPSSEGLEDVLTDVAPEELARFNEAYDAFQQAEQAMGPTM